MPRKRKSSSGSGSRSANKRKTDLKSEPAEEAELAASTVKKEEEMMNDAGEEAVLAASTVKKEEEMNGAGAVPSTEADEEGPDAVFVGDPVPDEEARKRWPKRYEK
ncbi:hypothetical protein PIB30_099785, partial [Stylosanthes scabra]|nr:hypothetical protein [Stylosanthes scabra]